MLEIEFCYDDVRIMSYNTLTHELVSGADPAILADYMLDSFSNFMTDCIAHAQGRLQEDSLVSYHFYFKPIEED